MPKNEGYVEQSEFYQLNKIKKWGYVESLHKLISKLKIQAEKNCAECEQDMLSEHDINIDYHFEDWRECSEHCDVCNNESKSNMCSLQFEIINHLANSLSSLQEKHNALFKIVVRKDEYGKKILKRIKDEEELGKERSKDLFS